MEDGRKDWAQFGFNNIVEALFGAVAHPASHEPVRMDLQPCPVVFCFGSLYSARSRHAGLRQRFDGNKAGQDCRESRKARARQIQCALYEA